MGQIRGGSTVGGDLSVLGDQYVAGTQFANLAVIGSIAADAAYALRVGGAGYVSGALSVLGNVGIGTTASATIAFDLLGSAGTASVYTAKFKNSSTAITAITVLGLLADDNKYLHLGVTGSLYNDSETSYDNSAFITTDKAALYIKALATAGIIKFFTGGDTLATHSRMMITAAGLVGIGTNFTPTEKFHVSGNVRLDVAPTTGVGLYITDSTLTQGNTVSIYTTSTAGVSSTNPASLMVSKSGAQAAASVTNHGIYVSVTSSGTTSINRGITVVVSGATDNTGINISSTGTGAVGLNVASGITTLRGLVGIGGDQGAEALKVNGSAQVSTYMSVNGDVSTINRLKVYGHSEIYGGDLIVGHGGLLINLYYATGWKYSYASTIMGLAVVATTDHVVLSTAPANGTLGATATVSENMRLGTAYTTMSVATSFTASAVIVRAGTGVTATNRSKGIFFATAGDISHCLWNDYTVFDGMVWNTCEGLKLNVGQSGGLEALVLKTTNSGSPTVANTSVTSYVDIISPTFNGAQFNFPGSLASTSLSDASIAKRGIYFTEAQTTCTDTPISSGNGAFLSLSDVSNDVNMQVWMRHDATSVWIRNKWGGTQNSWTALRGPRAEGGAGLIAVSVADPVGGIISTRTQDNIGYLKITLPHTWNDGMISLKVDVYSYGTHPLMTFHIGGYAYGSGYNTWVHSPQAYVTGSDGMAYNVRFGHDGTKCCIYIGESTTNWWYRTVRVRDVVVGYDAVIDSYVDPFSVSVTPTLGTITATVSLGYTGLGVRAPRAKLDVLGSGAANTNADVADTAIFTGPNNVMGAAGQPTTVSICSNDAVAINKGGTLAFGGRYSGSDGAAHWAMIKGAHEDGVSGNFHGYLSFGTRPQGGVITERMRITSTGAILVGGASPAAYMDIYGAASGTLFSTIAPEGTYGNRAISHYHKTGGLAGLDPVSEIRFVWYSDYWSLRAHRSGAQPMDRFSIALTGVEKLALSTAGSLAIAGPTLTINSKLTINAVDSFLRINEGSECSNGIWLGNSNIQTGTAFICAGSNGTASTARVRITGGTYDGTVAIDINGSTGNINTTGTIGCVGFWSSGGVTNRFWGMTGSSYNEGIRIGRATNGYSLISLGTGDNGSINSDTGWVAGQCALVSAPASASYVFRIDVPNSSNTAPTTALSIAMGAVATFSSNVVCAAPTADTHVARRDTVKVSNYATRTTATGTLPSVSLGCTGCQIISLTASSGQAITVTFPSGGTYSYSSIAVIGTLDMGGAGGAGSGVASASVAGSTTVTLATGAYSSGGLVVIKIIYTKIS